MASSFQDHDHPYKLLFSHPEMVRDLLLTFVKEDWVGQLDFATLEKQNARFVTDDLRDREDDLIWRVRLAGRWLYVYILLEFQSSPDRFMAVRLMTYLGLLYQDLIRSGQISGSEVLPPVLPLVLYNGQARWSAPLQIATLIAEGPGSLQRFRPDFRYLLIDEGAYDKAELATHRNAVSALFRLETCRTPEEVRSIVAELVFWLRAPEQTRLRRDFAVWFGRTFLPGRVPGAVIPEFHDLQEVDAMLSETVREWTIQWKEQGLAEGRAQGLEEGRMQGLEEGRAKGRAEGRAEGQAEAKTEIARRMLEKGLDLPFIAEVTGLSIEEIRALIPRPPCVCEPTAPYQGGGPATK
ncbi:MAG: putative transposase [Candidatus Ozemobacter sibiricus]|jgi:predicted transposase YdaD|uniref:Putative transposase n=1 Tax=Candidatus Ozemobacter sibiricus TaxID=2268124 RepID=A0A367ZTX4_9BACT|nr:MAG: putative transposase [Candidatus Ozemobacter sibiricus]